MKRSVKLLSGFGIGIALLVVGLLLLSRLIVTSPDFRTKLLREDSGASSGSRISKSYDIREFTQIYTEGNWELEVIRGEDYSIRLEVSDYLASRLEVEKTGERLDIGFLKNTKQRKQAFASITLPDIEGVESSGALDLSVIGVDDGNLRLSSSGALNARAVDSSFASVEISVSGASDINLSDSPVDDAEIRISGAGQVRILMNGGNLAGALSGAGIILYSGKISNLDVRTSGLSSVERAEE